MVIQGIKDRSKIREGEVMRKQGCGDEGEIGKRESKKDPETGVCGTTGRSGEDPGKIHRSRGFDVQECWEWEKSGETRIVLQYKVADLSFPFYIYCL